MARLDAASQQHCASGKDSERGPRIVVNEVGFTVSRDSKALTPLGLPSAVSALASGCTTLLFGGTSLPDHTMTASVKKAIFLFLSYFPKRHYITMNAGKEPRKGKKMEM